MTKTHSIWVERFRSKSLDSYVGNDELKTRIEEFIKKNDIPHLLLYGPTGTGKTTLAKLIVNNINCDYIYINASDENGIDMVREKIKGFAITATFQPLKVVILDEADFITQPGQAALRNLIEEYSLTTRFILTCNYIEKIIEPLQSRCEKHALVAPPKSEIAKHICTNILDVEGITYDIKDVAQVIKEYYPDIRSVINNLQRNIKNTVLEINTTNYNWIKNIVDLLKKPTSKTWYEIRQIIADNNVDDYQVAIRYLFDNIKEYAKNNEAQITIYLDEYQWRANSVPDKEINFSALISRILETIK